MSGMCFWVASARPVAGTDARGGGASLPRRESLVCGPGSLTRWGGPMRSGLRHGSPSEAAVSRAVRGPLQPHDVLNPRAAGDAAQVHDEPCECEHRVVVDALGGERDVEVAAGCETGLLEDRHDPLTGWALHRGRVGARHRARESRERFDTGAPSRNAGGGERRSGF